MHRWQPRLLLAADMCGVGGGIGAGRGAHRGWGQSWGMSCGIWTHSQLDSVGIELNCKTPTQLVCWKIAWWWRKIPHSSIGIRITHTHTYKNTKTGSPHTRSQTVVSYTRPQKLGYTHTYTRTHFHKHIHTFTVWVPYTHTKPYQIVVFRQLGPQNFCCNRSTVVVQKQP